MTPDQDLLRLCHLSGQVESWAAVEHVERGEMKVGNTHDGSEKVAAWMIAKSYATGHGDTVEDMLGELEWQAMERMRNKAEAAAKGSSEEFDFQSTLAECRDNEYSFHNGRIAAAHAVAALKAATAVRKGNEGCLPG